MTDPTDPDVERFSEADVEAVAEATWAAAWDVDGWGHAHPSSKSRYRMLARAALAVYTGRLTEERDALREAVTQLHDFISLELDPDPSPVEGYITDPAAAQAAEVAVLTREARRPL